MPVVVFRHEAPVDLGHFATVFERLQVNFIYRDLGDRANLSGCSGLLVLGGSMSANDPLPGLAAELILIQEAVVKGVPVLGICLGAQLIAKALGSRVYSNPVKEIGWAPVHLTGAGRTDPILQGIDWPAQFFHWHQETFELPPGAEVLAYSDRCRYQAVRFGEAVYGVQFHPEVTAGMITAWCADPASCAEAAASGLPTDPRAFDSGPAAEQILERWLAIAERTISEQRSGPLS